MSLPQIQLPDSALLDFETDCEPLALPLYRRRRSSTMVELDRRAPVVETAIASCNPRLSPPSLGTAVQAKRSRSHMNLQLAIPTPVRKKILSCSVVESDTPSTSENSPELDTPASLGSPIAGVVDLTKNMTTLSKYPVAQGGLSDIYLGEWQRAKEDMDDVAEERKTVSVAIKLLRIFATKDQDDIRARKKLNKEVYVWHRLEHPNVVKLFGTSYHMSGRPAMVMQWYENGSATDYLTKNPNADRLQLILDVARGLAYLHTLKPRPIVHADLKGNNVLITDEGRAVLSDFGLSKVVEDLGRPTGFTLSNPDVAGGPLRWQAPEFLDNDDEPATLASDIWSYGCTAYELLSGHIPYAHRTRDPQIIRDMERRIKPCGPNDFKSTNFLRLNLDSRVKALIDSCWSFLPEERPCMTDIQANLEDICGCKFASTCSEPAAENSTALS